MRISLNWLKDYLDSKADMVDMDQLCQSLTMAGLEVENVEVLKELDDTAITLGITPNRADALSHLGVSRELAAVLDLGTRSPMLSLKEMAGPIHEKVSIEIENADDCPRYALRVLENVKVEESPDWLKKRLEACGIRPINNIVDVTNYVMLDRGQPMHAFDLDRLSKDGTRVKMLVRRAKADEKLVMLDGREVKLDALDLVIADVNGPLALAGIMGGKESAIDANTTSIVLEAAYFEPKNVRMSARRHGIITDSSYRFERGVDPNGVVDALNYAARLIVEMGEAKSCREAIDAYRKRIDPLELHMRPERAQAVLGMSAETFDQDVIRRKFLRLGIETVAKRGDAIYFRVPTFRADLTREIDLIEEAARMIGYDKVKESVVGNNGETDRFIRPELEAAVKKLRTRLVARGFFEAVNYGFLNREYQNHFTDDKEAVVEVLNPLSERYNVMRTSLIPGLLKNVKFNQRNQELNVQLFEVGTVFLGKRQKNTQPNPESLAIGLDQDSFAEESHYVAGVMTGLGTYRAFDDPQKSRDFYHVKGLIEECFSALGFKEGDGALVLKAGTAKKYLHPKESITVLLNGHEVGSFGKLHPECQTACEVIGDVFVFEFALPQVATRAIEVPRFKAFSKFPFINRDVALVMEENVLIGDILGLVEEINKQHQKLAHINVFDIYRGKNIGNDKKSVAFSLTFQHQERTLVDEDADAFVSEFLQKAEQRFSAVVR